MAKNSIRVALVLVAIILVGPISADDRTDFTPPPFKVPEGFTIEVVASPPLVKYPMMGCFDDRGRLFVAETLGQNLNKKQLLEKRCRFIRMLEDTDHDGKFDKSTIFADKLVMPEGALWHRGSLYVLSSPYLWRFQDTNDDGVADVREKLVGYMDFTGQANQHGAYLGPNGRLYFSGGHLGYDLKSKNGTSVAKGRAAGVFSSWQDGSDVQVFGNGGINPVEVAFTPEGELLTTCAIFDSIGGRHDALIHWVRGATAGPKDYAKPVLKQTGYRIGSVRRWGQVAPSGLTRYRSKTFGNKYVNTFFATHFNTATVVNTRLRRSGSTFDGTDHAFVTSTSRDFHPTDVIEDADGSLLMIDTGGWFLISCPLSKVAKPDVMGAIYRIKRTGHSGPVDPRGLKIDWKAASGELVQYLGDPRPVVRDRAIEVLRSRADVGAMAIQAAWPEMSEQQRRNAVWSLSRMGSELSRALLRTALGDEFPSVVQAATRSVGNWQDGLGFSSLLKILESDSMPHRRAAATALGQIGDTRAIPKLLEALQKPGDDHLRHALVYALIEMGDAEATAQGLSHANPRVQHASLVAIDQMEPMALRRQQVAPLLTSDDDMLRRAALRIVTSRKGWSDQIIQLLDDWSRGKDEDKLESDLVVAVISAFYKDQRVQAVVARTLESGLKNPAKMQPLLRSMGRIDPFPDVWLPPIRKLLRSANPTMQAEVIAAIATARTTQLNDELLRIGSDGANPKSIRLMAWNCLAETGAALPDRGFEIILGQIRNEQLPLDRLAGTRAMRRASLSRGQLIQLIDELPTLGAAELPTLLEKADEAATNDLRLTQQLARVRKVVSAKLNALKTTDQKVRQRVKQVSATLKSGDAKHGEALFFSQRATCSACHTVTGRGGVTGPDLSRIGAIRRRADLLEAILFPNASIVNGYETYSVETKDGRVESGVIQRADARWLVLRDARRKEITISRDAIEKLHRSGLSIMPKGLESNLRVDELSDLLAFLESLGNSTKK